VKRTLRERWQEVAQELLNLRATNVYLFTADEDISDDHVDRICGEYRIHLVVWDDVKARRFASKDLVLGYTQWATSELGLLRDRWAADRKQRG
jgi:hypothetical protein